MSREYISIDVETTGLSPDNDRIIELGAVRFMDDGEEIDRFQSFCKPSKLIPDFATEIHGITNEMVKDAPLFGHIVPSFLKFISSHVVGMQASPLLAHNSAFDARMIGAELRRNYPNHKSRFEIICTHKFAKQQTVKLKSYSLPYLVMHYGFETTDFKVGASHRAIEDCLHVKNLWLKLGGPTVDHGSLWKATIE